MSTETANAPAGVIRVLSEEVVGRIAAGEVVERPASVVKELVENAVDARGRRIEIEIKEGGQKLIEITDDGIGMCRQDAVLAFTPHATSKISSETDLDHLESLGFRGEALATIAAVSRVTLVTRLAGSEAGTRLQVDGGRLGSVELDHFPRGTRIQVRNLFFNVPARRKFLKSVQSEMAQISDIVCHYMLGYPEIAFRFTRNNAPLADSPGTGSLVDAVLAVYGPEVTRSLLPLKEPLTLAGTGASIRGFISRPTDARPSNRYMTLLVNRRYVRSKLLSQAVAKALSAFFPKGRWPVLVFDLRLPPEMVDANVHPQKTEVRFRDERWVFGMVWETLQTTLSGLSMVAPASALTPRTTPDPGAAEADSASEQDAEDDAPAHTAAPVAHPSLFGSLSPAPANSIPIHTQNLPAGRGRIYELKDGNERLAPGSSPVQPLEPVITLNEPRILAQLLQSYLLGEDRDGMFIIDQHAAHERILFDTYVQAYRDQKIAAQPLLFPIPVKLLPSERMIMKERGEQLKELGFGIQQEEDGQFYATAVPMLGGKSADGETIQDLLAQVLGGWESRSLDEIKIDLLKMMACKAAVKAGDPLKEPEMRSLLEQLLKTPNPFTCPHGRPIVVRLTTRQIEHGFLRA
ncbi:MAG TPA: DNA mismatch repair endonuclease MutL [Candidatus Ozemobacteraceae bacterium]|mgnify:CR=1 FL=1|nr:DNA mismatch repair endonuclease MutL [Candidatus Ozemobacteraceae bacterium]